QRIELCHFGIQQGTIDNVDPGQQNHLISFLSTLALPRCQDNVLHHVYFGKAIGDQLRFIGVAASVDNTQCYTLLFKGAGIVNIPSGRVGARSCIAVQRGVTRLQIANFYADGAQNSIIDFEPSGVGALEDINIHDFIADQSLGNSAVAISFGGAAGNTLFNGRLANFTVKAGVIIVADLNGGILENFRISTTVPLAGSPLTSLVSLINTCTDVVIKNPYLSRTGTSGIGELFKADSGSYTRLTLDGGFYNQETQAHPILLDACTDFKAGGGLTIRYNGPIPAGRDAIFFKAIIANANNPQINDVQILSPGGKLRAGIEYAARTPRTMLNIRTTNLHCAGQVTRAIWYSLGAGATMDTTPYQTGIDAGTDPVWKQADAGDNPITTIFPQISGDAGVANGGTGAVAGGEFVGEAAPETVLAVPVGSMYTYLQQTGSPSTASRWRKENQTTAAIADAIGWIMVGGSTITPAAIGAGPTNDYAPANIDGAEQIRQDTSVAAVVTGLAVSAAARGNGRSIIITNIGINTLTLNHEDVGSVAANRFSLAGGTAKVLAA
ncbi:MAG: hypothetical protein L0220_06705, partial [Acidobacteria bacterium]|nr:hypothetical protein [Acidobacteriota bacterium]